MQVSKTIDSYNARRYGKPWAARIKSFDGRPELDFIGHAYNGSDAGGELVFDAEPGEVLKIGQRDNRGNCGSNGFYRVGADGNLEQIESAVDARKAWETWKAAAVDSDKITISVSKLTGVLARYGLKDAEKAAIIRAATE